MPGTVATIMNARLLYVAEGERPKSVKAHILKFGVSSVPVLDAAHKPVGVLALRDFAKSDDPEPSSPVDTVEASATVEAGARRLAESGRHRLVVVDDEGRAVGMVSATDFVRALVGLPPSHPAPFERVRAGA